MRTLYVLIQLGGLVLFWKVGGFTGIFLCALCVVAGGLGYRHEQKKIKAQKNDA